MWFRKTRNLAVPDADEAGDALASAEAEHQAALELAPEVEQLAAELRQLRMENHFAERIRMTLRGDHV